MSILDVIGWNESSGGKNTYNPILTSSGHAQGVYQITDGTWQDFAPKAGVSLLTYPNANAAPQDVQAAVAGQIPLSRWAPSTVDAVHAAYPATVGHDSMTVGQLQQTYGDGTASSGLPGGITGGSDQHSTDPAYSYLGGANPNIPANIPTGPINAIWEVISRGLLVFCGFLLVIVAMIALLFESKTGKMVVKRAGAAVMA